MSKKMKKKKMKYDMIRGGMFKGKSVVLYHGYMNSHIKGEKREVIILNICGHHPTAYIKIPFSVAYDVEMMLDVHGRVTYTGKCPVFDIEDEVTTATEGAIWIGWDYNHFNDFKPRGDIQFKFDNFIMYRHKWTTEEIYAEVRYAVRQLNAWKIPTKRSNDEADCSIDYPIPIKKLS